MGNSRHEQVALRPLSGDDIGVYLSMFSEPVRRALCVGSIESERKYLLQSIAEIHSSVFGIFCQDTFIGAVFIRDGDRHAGQLYCWLHHDFWGTGIFTQALNLAAQKYFDETHSRFFTARVDRDNMRSYRALKKNGFADVGVVRGPRGKQYELVLRNTTQSNHL